MLNLATLWYDVWVHFQHQVSSYDDNTDWPNHNCVHVHVALFVTCRAHYYGGGGEQQLW